MHKISISGHWKVFGFALIKEKNAKDKEERQVGAKESKGNKLYYNSK